MNNERLDILNLKVNHISFEEAIVQVKYFAYSHSPSYVCFANSHMTIEAQKNKEFAQQVNNASLVLADGMPLVYASSLLHKKKQERIAGMDFMPRLLASINEETNRQYRIFLYGSTFEVLNSLEMTIKERYKNIIIAGSASPPFRHLEPWEQEANINKIQSASPHIVFVGLGCPKQEKWMAMNSKKINAVLLGVGGAFATTANVQARAPQWMQKNSLEWLYRLCQEPRRLFKRYFITNSLFLFMLTKAFIKKLFYGGV
jgi:N-acetylglucosaminyldiphosphoundecaprenol N-acetyl-beta-D-mannosaminyltransferase